jgi:hypothetical protein
MPTYHVTPSRLGAFMLLLNQKQREVAMRAMQGAVVVDGPRLIHEEISATVPQPVDRGGYRRMWRAERTADGAVLYNPLPYAAIIEAGRRPGAAMPPVDALTDWVIRKRLVKGRGIKARAEARGVAFVIARKIAERGLPAKRVLARAVKRLVPLATRAISDALSKPLGI